MADVLEDDFYIQETIVAESGEESDEQNGKSEALPDNEKKPVKINIKRTTDNTEADGEPPKKKKKRKRKRITEELSKNKPINAKKEELVDFIHQNFDDKLSAVEWDDLKLDIEADLFQANEVGKSSSEYVQLIVPKWKKLLQISLIPGSPLVLVLTASAIRAVELIRELNEFKTEKCKTAKLFGKHLKVTEQQQYLSKHICHLAVGTPLRVLNLVKLGCLKLDKLVCVVLDWNKRDVKSKRMMDIPEVKQALLDLFKGGLVSAVHNSQSRFALL